MGRFSGQVAVVTGAASGIGEATARAFHREGASVIVLDINEVAAQRVADSLGDTPRVFSAGVDISDASALDQIMAAAAERFGRLDFLANCAGIRGVSSVLDVDQASWERVHAVNLTGTLNAMQSFARLVIAAGKPAAIVNVTSVGGISGVPNRAAYVSSKHAVVGVTRAMAMESGKSGIRVNAVAPGMIRTPMSEANFQEPGAEARIAAAHAVGRAGTAEEVAAAILFLSSDAASFITGVILPVDGGWTAGRGW